jgi:hypothetical protein
VTFPEATENGALHELFGTVTSAWPLTWYVKLGVPASPVDVLHISRNPDGAAAASAGAANTIIPMAIVAPSNAFFMLLPRLMRIENTSLLRGRRDRIAPRSSLTPQSPDTSFVP